MNQNKFKKKLDIEARLYMKLFGLKEEKNKKYSIEECETNVVYLFNDYDEFKSYFELNGFSGISKDILESCKMKTTRKGTIIVLKRLCDYAIRKHSLLHINSIEVGEQKSNKNDENPNLKQAQQNYKPIATIKNISLDAKVDDYIEWNYENIVKGHYSDIGEYWVPIELRNFIEKMAVWYELRYPDYEINRLMPGSEQEATEISDVMFNSNDYINELFDENADVRAIDWDEFYNTHTFIKSLPWEERYRFQRARYKDLVYIDPNYTLHSPMEVEKKTAHLHLTPNGFVNEAEGIDCYSKFKVTNEELKGMHVKEVVALLKERGIILPSDNELESTIKNVEKFIKEKEGMLDAVMYRIIERGGNRMGPRRGFLFAKEFGRDINVPMMYAIDRSDPGLRLFINEYLKAGGSKDLICYIGYFSRTNKSKKLDTISIQDLILTQNNNAATFYTPEETKLHQRMVNAISSQINQEEVRKEEVQQLRLQRKLEKSKKTNH